MNERDLQKLARRLVSLSPVLESEALRNQTRSNLIDALEDFASLEDTIRNSVTPSAPAPAHTPVSAPVAPPRATPSQAQAPAAKPAQSKKYTAKSEYQPALNNQGLINALLDYHRRSSPRKSGILRPGEDTNFVSAKIPEVKADVKDERGFARSPNPGYPILRSRRDK